MKKTIIICGYGPGIGDAVARKFGSEGFRVAIVSRSAENVRAGAGLLAENGVEAHGFACDLADPVATATLISDIHDAMGPITVLHWNAYFAGAANLMTADATDFRTLLALGAESLLAAARVALEDLSSQSGASSVLLTGGGLANDEADEWAAGSGMAGLALCKAIQHKVIGLLHAQLADQGVYVGEVMVQGMVRGSANPAGTIEADDVANRLWEAYSERGRVLRHVP